MDPNETLSRVRKGTLHADGKCHSGDENSHQGKPDNEGKPVDGSRPRDENGSSGKKDDPKGKPAWPVQKPGEKDCSDCAKEIQKIVGGKIERIEPVGRVLGPSDHNPEGDWYFHDVVVKDGHVYDSFTGSTGLSEAEYKEQFTDGHARFPF